MSQIKTLQDLFKRYRRPGDFFIALLSFLFAAFLLINLQRETSWAPRTALFAQPAFWPTISIAAMVVFSGLHLVGALVSERIPGRLAEVLHWVRSLEYALWFMAYALLVPQLGYLVATVVFALLLTSRLGYRDWRMFVGAIAFAIVVVVLFRGLLHVKIPSGALYDLLPQGGLRRFFLTYL